MKWLLTYFRQCFCRHQFDHQEQRRVIEPDGNLTRTRTNYVAICRKCGYSTQYWSVAYDGRIKDRWR